MKSTDRASASRLPVYLLCWICLVADGYDLMAYGATLPSLIGSGPFHLTVDQAGHIASVALAGMLAGSLAAGMLTDRVGRRRIFIVSVTLFSVGMVLTALAPSVGTFTLLRVVTCFGVGGLLPTGVAMASEFARPETRSRTLGFVLTGPPVGMVVATFLSSRILADHGFRPVYAAGGVILLVVPLLVRYLPESPSFLAVRGRDAEAQRVRATYGLPTPTGAPVPAVDVRKTPVAALLGRRFLVSTLLIWATTFFSLLTVFGITTWLPQVMAKSGYGLGSSVSFLLVYCLGAVVGTIVAATIADRIGPKPLVLVGYVTAAVALLAISREPATVVLVVLVLLAGFGGFGTQNILNDFIARFYPAEIRASGLGWALGIGRVGAIIGPTFGAWAVSGNDPLTATATAFAITAVLGALVMALVPRAAPESTAVPSGAGEHPLSDTEGATR